MLQDLRDQTQGTGFKILVGAIILVLVLFGFGATNLFLGGDVEIAQVGDFEITQNLLATESERERRRILGQMGPDFDASNIDRLQLQEYVLNQVINRQVLYQTTAQLGIAVSPEAVNEELISSPAYQVDGQFNEAMYRQQVQLLGYTPLNFVAEFGAALGAEALRGNIVESVAMPEWELAEIVRVVSQRRDLAYLPLTVEAFRESVEVTDEEITLRYTEDQSAYMTPLSLDARYVRLTADKLLGQLDMEVAEKDLLDLYEDDRQAALADEQRDSSHVLIQINSDRNEAQALQLITETQIRLAEGESFASLAQELSEDPGSAPAGGALGAVGKGIFDPAFENALWALPSAGDISTPVLTSFGYHLIQLNDIVVPDYPDFDLQKEGLAQRVRAAKAQELFADKALEFERAAYEEGFSLDATAQALGLSIELAEGISRSVPGDDTTMQNNQVLDALFSDAVLEGRNSDAVELGDTDIVIVRVEEQHAPEPIPLADVEDDIRLTIEREKALAEIENAKVDGLARLEAGESVTEIAHSLGSKWQSFALATRANSAQGIPAQILAAAFDLPRPTEGEKSVGLAGIPDGSALVTVTRVVQGDINTTTDAEVAELRRISENRTARFDFQSFFQAAQERLGVSRPAS